jgi:hypothetical protein
MKLRNLHFIALALLGMGSSGHGEPVEEIYIARSVREATMPPTEFCTKAKTGVDRASSEDKFTFRSMAARASDGRVTDTDAGTIGSAHSCGGLVADKPGISQFYGEFVLGGLAFKAIGECHLAKADFPERGLSTLFCVQCIRSSSRLCWWSSNNEHFLQLHLSDTEPPGYAQPSIATVRLWKKRVQ